MGTTYHLLNEILLPHITSNRVLVAINQADVVMKGRHWQEDINQPDTVLKDYLDQMALSIQSRVKEATGVMIPLPVYYSAEKNYNITKLLDLIIDHIPNSRRIIA
jgi:predicted GTPase